MFGDPIPISSATNPRIKKVVRLRRRSHRDELGLMIVEGCREIGRAMANSHPLQELFFCEEFCRDSDSRNLIRDCRRKGIELLECSSAVFQRIAYRDRPEGPLAVASHIRHSLGDIRLKSPCLLVITETIEKPGNLGAILRSADAAGADAVIVCDQCTDINNPNVVRASIGTIFALPVVTASFDDVMPWLANHGIRIVATTPDAERLYTDPDYRQNTAVVLGSEQKGLSSLWLENAQERVRIPMRGQSDSLNVSAAATLLLYEAVRQRGMKAEIPRPRSG